MLVHVLTEVHSKSTQKERLRWFMRHVFLNEDADRGVVLFMRSLAYNFCMEYADVSINGLPLRQTFDHDNYESLK